MDSVYAHLLRLKLLYADLVHVLISTFQVSWGARPHTGPVIPICGFKDCMTKCRESAYRNQHPYMWKMLYAHFPMRVRCHSAMFTTSDWRIEKMFFKQGIRI